MLKLQLTEKGERALTQPPSRRCVDYLRHEFFCHHRGRMYGLNWRTKDGCSNDCCLACFYAVDGPASWLDLHDVQAVLKRERNFARSLLA